MILFKLFGGMGLISKLITIAVLVAAVGTAYGIWHHKIYMKGWRAHEAAIARQDAKAIAATKRARDKLNECRSNGMRWDQSTGECVRR